LNNIKNVAKVNAFVDRYAAVVSTVHCEKISCFVEIKDGVETCVNCVN
jgi:hypothetical protein